MLTQIAETHCSAADLELMMDRRIECSEIDRIWPGMKADML